MDPTDFDGFDSTKRQNTQEISPDSLPNDIDMVQPNVVTTPNGQGVDDQFDFRESEEGNQNILASEEVDAELTDSNYQFDYSQYNQNQHASEEDEEEFHDNQYNSEYDFGTMSEQIHRLDSIGENNDAETRPASEINVDEDNILQVS